MERKTTRAIGRQGLATALATALAFSPVAATPARAGGDEAVAVIAFGTLLTMFTAGLIASNVQDRDHHPRPLPPRPQPQPPRPKPQPPVAPSKQLPMQCKFRVPYGVDRGGYFRSSCLVRNYTRWSSLPRVCEESVRLPREGYVRAYRARCLAGYGYGTR
ncbi:MAG: hypothetical protein D6801_00710 [Alphaproteobacteria bacterium]|nr:MAG: hypothetical protein D6801_00710 [Alphaproteobacteria bacterium]